MLPQSPTLDDATDKRAAPELRCEIGKQLPDRAVEQLGRDVLQLLPGFFAREQRGFELFVVKWFSGTRLVGVVPVIKMSRRRTTDMIKGTMRRWANPLMGFFARRTTLLLDTALLGYDYASPCYCVDDADAGEIKRRTVAELRRIKGVDSIWINEPEAESGWASAEGFDSFRILPMVYVDTAGCDSMAAYVAGLSKKRRRNRKQAQATFQAAGATITQHEAPLDAEYAEAAFALLQASARRSSFHVPYGDILNCRETFLQQRQKMLIAWIGARMIGFVSFVHNGDLIQQTHGGFDYDASLDAMAYHNLIDAATEYAISHGAARLMLGPLNNETKRRLGSGLLPVVGSLWNRRWLDRSFSRKLFVPNFEIYRGPVLVAGSEQDAAC